MPRQRGSGLRQMSDAREYVAVEPMCGNVAGTISATQHATGPPTFAIFANRPDLISASYKRFVENNLRREFDFEGTPLRIHWRRRTATSPSRARTGVEA